MIQRQPRPRGQAEKSIGHLKLGRGWREAFVRQSLHQAIAKIGPTQKGTFCGKVANFIEDIDHPQLKRCLHPIEDHRRVDQAHMFWPQVAMPLNHKPCRLTCRDFWCHLVKPVFQIGGYRCHRDFWHDVRHVEQVFGVDRLFPLQMHKIEALSGRQAPL